MPNKTIISTQQLISLVAFISAAIMTSLFLFHLKQQQSLTQLSDNRGVVFPVAREIKPFKLMTGNQAFSLNNLHGHWTLLFFGFTHCHSICPITLEKLNEIYPILVKHHPELQIVFISLDPDRDTPTSASQYAKRFNQKFIGVTGKINEIRKLQSQLGIAALREKNQNNDQLQHASTILLINPAGKWTGLLNNNNTPRMIESAVLESINILA